MTSIILIQVEWCVVLDLLVSLLSSELHKAKIVKKIDKSRKMK